MTNPRGQFLVLQVCTFNPKTCFCKCLFSFIYFSSISSIYFFTCSFPLFVVTLQIFFIMNNRGRIKRKNILKIYKNKTKIS